MPAVRITADPRRPRMLPPRRIGRPRSASLAHHRPAVCRTGVHPDPSNKLQTDIYSSQPVRRFKAGLFMAFSQAGGRSWVRLATLVTLVTVAGVAVRFGLDPQTPAFCYLAAVGVPLAFIDVREYRLPGGTGRFVHALIGMGVVVALFFLLLLAFPAGIGLGDVKLAGPLGAYLGWLGATAFVAGLMGAWLLAGVTGLGLMAAGRATRKTQLAFGPFLIAAALGVALALGR